MKVYVNGRFVESDQATLSIHDAAVQHAVGLFETMQAFDGKVYRLDGHLQRLIDSAAELGLSRQLRARGLAELVAATLAENALKEARIRLTITGGSVSLLAAARGADERQKPVHQPGVICVATPPTEYPPGDFEQGIMVTIADARANPFDPLAGHKTTAYWARLGTLVRASAAGAGETLWLSAISNHLVGGAVSNAFLVRDGRLLSPIARGEESAGALPSATLPGITRQAVIELAESAGIVVDRKMIAINEVLDADELFLTNSSWQVLPVVRVEKKKIGNGQPGELTGRIRRMVLDDIAATCSQQNESSNGKDPH